ncbi:P-loop containing nucleoside triphosphate hydrolase [Aspergillus terreus]|uniref:P-loop containing nucleoside triphosphate hydrolase n=1 Tax=Aspergillus terreus TaxID=33178 RepID=A0A5M3Z6A3_ASPTE|nr:hypothetical protein ATETN484_0010030900 [Aspergillus terreus]GFF18356.1 P-loop containing nucleoside triphosphate hydrolase [Aspergillus terreus]
MALPIADNPASEKLDNPPEKADIQIAEREVTPSERLSSSNNEDVDESHKDERSSSDASNSENAGAILEARYETSRSMQASQEDNTILKTYEEACKHFRSRGGVTYVSNDLWAKYRLFAIDCHVYVGSTNPPGGSAEQTPESQANGAGEAAIAAKGTLPFRLRLMNAPLLDEMAKIVGYSINNDHVAPFRSIVTYEQEFRAKLKELEEGFSRLAEHHPEDPAVTRTRAWLPWSRAYSSNLGTTLDGQIRIQVHASIETTDLDDARILLDGFRALVYLLDNDLADLIQTHRQAREGTVKSIYFSHLWHLFWPGQEIVTKSPNKQVFRVIQVSGGRRSLVPRKAQSSRNTISNLVIDCFHLDYDGKQVRPVPKTIAIRPYVGERLVTALCAYPLQYVDETTKSELTKRGTKFVDLVKVSHKRYKGLSLTNEDFHKLEEIESDVIIDFELAYRSGDPGIKRPNFGGGVIVQPTEEDEEETHDGDISYDNEEFRTARYFKFLQHTALLEDRALYQLEREHLILLPDRVFGYVLLSRKWYPLNIDLISDLKTIKEGAYDAFDDLVLPKKHRKIIRALVKTHARARGALGSKTDGPSVQRQFDIVRGKGKGLIILLHGAPGVGKTSTAECVAAHTGRPLFPITCGDLGGNSAQEVERNLEQFFDLAMRWGCVLLLDEADVFLGERIQGNIVQNSLVSVFLRVLEYYSGVLILTTNRVGQFDEAATSRIHCALYYPPFSKRRALEVWQKNVDRIKRDNETSKVPVELNEKRIMKFADAQWEAGSRWNGRQIKNAFQTAVALADWDSLKKSKDGPSKLKLQIKHFEAVVEASNHFESYLTAVRKSDRERARINALRRDDVNQDLEDYYRPNHVTKKAPQPKWPGAEKSDDSDDDEEEEEDEEEESSESDSESKSESEPEPSKKKKSKKNKEKEKAKGKGKKDSKSKKSSSKSKKAPEPSESSSSSESDSGNE